MIDKLENIGFYTLSDDRARNICSTSPMWRAELIITDRCNFSCEYCRGLRPDCLGDMSLEKAYKIIWIWTKDHLKNIRFSGGEPTLHKNLIDMVQFARVHGVERVALSTNGSAKTELYQKLVNSGVSDFSISLDACCASFADVMAGKKINFDIISNNIKYLSKLTYVTVGIVVTDSNVGQMLDVIRYAHGLGVSDIRVIPAAQQDRMLEGVKDLEQEIIDAHPILKYRVNNIKNGIHVRGIQDKDTHKCHLAQDDTACCGNFHFPCIIYMRELGDPIGKIGPNMRDERIEWFKNHDTHTDPICKKNCLDACIDLNNKIEYFAKIKKS